MGEQVHGEPLLSFAVPVRNGEAFLPRLLASLRAQDEPRVEIVVCDNCSTDATGRIAREAASVDRRVRYVRNDRDIGQIANFNRAAELSRGRYLRWIGCDDWLEPTYATRCIRALERAPDAIAVTTYQDHVGDDGSRGYFEYQGERLDSDRPGVRFRRMLWFCTSDYRYIDPIYSTMRRSALERTRRLLVVADMDQVLATELAVAGRFVHVPECLAHRRREAVDRSVLVHRYDPVRHRDLDGLGSLGATIAAMWEPVERARLGRPERAACALTLARYASTRAHGYLEPPMRRGVRSALERVAPELVEAVRQARRAKREEQRA